jgi:hypothetical protein
VVIIDRPSGRRLLPGVALMAAFVAAGCGGSNAPYPVQGTVYLDDQPAKELAGWSVTFNSAELHRSASGAIDAEGTYRLGSLKKDDGAIPGKYQVTLSPPETSESGERGGRRPAAKKVPFEAPPNLEVIVERRTNDIPIKLRRKGTPRR